MAENNSNGSKTIQSSSSSLSDLNDECLEGSTMAKNNSKESKTIQSSSSLSYLNDELLVEILCRLGSSKYAIQCKCVGKRWCSLIDVNSSRDSYFLCRWRKINREPPFALLTHYKDLVKSTSIISQNAIDVELTTVEFLDFLPWPSSNNNARYIHIHGVYKDLILCSQSSFDDRVYYRSYNHGPYCICNPFTRQRTVLPPPPRESPDYRVDVALFAPDDGNDIQKVKVVRVVSYAVHALQVWKNEDIVKVQIFSCDDNSGEWKIWNAPQSCLYFLRDHVSYNGMLFWLSDTIYNTYKLVRFKFDTRIVDNINQDIVNYTYLSLPPGFETERCSKLGAYSGGCLRIARMDSTPTFDSHKLIVWELHNHTQKWKLVSDMDFSEVEDFTIAKNSYRFLDGYVLAFHPHDRDVLYLAIDCVEKYSTALHSDECYMWSCNVRKKTAQHIQGKFPPIQQRGNVFPLQLPSWPSPVPLLSEKT